MQKYSLCILISYSKSLYYITCRKNVRGNKVEEIMISPELYKNQKAFHLLSMDKK